MLQAGDEGALAIVTIVNAKLPLMTITITTTTTTTTTITITTTMIYHYTHTYTPSPPTKTFPIKSPRVELSGILPIKFNGHGNSPPFRI